MLLGFRCMARRFAHPSHRDACSPFALTDSTSGDRTQGGNRRRFPARRRYAVPLWEPRRLCRFAAERRLPRVLAPMCVCEFRSRGDIPQLRLQTFWADSCHVLSSAVSSLIRLSLASISSGPHDPAPAITVQGSASSQPVHLLARLCAVLAAARSEHGWDVSEWALTRAGNVASRLRTVAGLSNEIGRASCRERVS